MKIYASNFKNGYIFLLTHWSINLKIIYIYNIKLMKENNQF